MQIWSQKFSHVTLVFLVFLWAGSLAAQEGGAHHGNVPETALGPPSEYIEPFGVPLAPPIYFVNFLILYVANPEMAANMPAYRAALPQEVYDCLFNSPPNYECSYAKMQPYFDEQAFDSGGSRNKNSFWPSACQEDPRWQRLAPPKYRHPDQINEPLGMRKAGQLARLLGIDDDMIFTDEEYQCLIGTPPRDDSREIIYQCINDLTNSNGNADPPLSSYGLYLNDQGNVRSLCAPEGPCLEFNQLFVPGNDSLWRIAEKCGFFNKLARLVAETPLLQFAEHGDSCQKDWEPSCIVETACPGNGGQSNSSCQDSLK